MLLGPHSQKLRPPAVRHITCVADRLRVLPEHIEPGAGEGWGDGEAGLVTRQGGSEGRRQRFREERGRTERGEQRGERQRENEEDREEWKR